jgi:hypothetical protein
MEPLQQSPKPIPVEPVNPQDLTFQVMPKHPGFSSALSSPVPAAPLPVMQKNSPPGGGKARFYIVLAIIVILLLSGGAFLFFRNRTPSQTSQTPDNSLSTKLPKIWTTKYFQKETCDNPEVCGDTADPDSDGLNNYDEFVANTDPTNPDTDQDGLADGDEVNIYKTEPTQKFTDRRDLVRQNNWVDGFQVKNNYDPLTPAIKFTDARKQQIADDTTQFGLHEPTITTLKSSFGM